MARLAEFGSRDREDFDAADLMIRPDVGDVPLLDFGRFDDLVERGHAEGMAALVAWQAAGDG
jgi:predicted acylesterase/phospholipase RssA